MNLIGLRRDNRCIMNGTSSFSQPALARSDDRYPCFAAAFRFCSNARATYDIDYELHIHKRLDGINNNFALFPKQDMCRILNSIKYLIPFTYHFEDDDEDYIVVMHLRGTALQQKGLLMLSRMLFEFPHNMCAWDALKVRQLGHLGNEDISGYSLVQLYLQFISSMHFSSDECFIADSQVKIENSKFIQKALKKRTGKIISNVLKTPFQVRLRRIPDWPSNTDNMQNEFAYRVAVYSANFKTRRDNA